MHVLCPLRPSCIAMEDGLGSIRATSVFSPMTWRPWGRPFSLLCLACSIACMTRWEKRLSWFLNRYESRVDYLRIVWEPDGMALISYETESHHEINNWDQSENTPNCLPVAADLQPGEHAAETLAAQLCRQEKRRGGQQGGHPLRQHLGQNFLQ